MGNKVLKILAIIILVPILLMALLWFIVIKPAAENKINTAIRSTNLPISGDPLKLFFFGLESASTLTINTKPVPIPLDQPRLRLSPFSIIRMNPKLILNSAIFGGRLNASLSYRISDSSVAADVKAEELQVSKYQLASMLGFTEGNVNFSFEGQGSNSKLLSPTKLFFMIKGLKKPRVSKLPQFISPIPINIPAVDNGELLAEVNCSITECKSNKFSFSSSLGQAGGNFLFPLAKNGEIQAAITVSLTQSGRTELLPYLGLLNQELQRFPEKPFILKLSGLASKPKLSVVPILDSM